jgi:hypothetical protein
MYTYEQTIARLWRLGQKLQVYIYIARLNTGNVKNINDRNVDIIDFFKKEVEAITGYASEIDIMAGDSTSSLSTEDMIKCDMYMNYASRNLEVFTNW